MKKFACLILALAMVFSLSITAGAVEPTVFSSSTGTAPASNKEVADVTINVNSSTGGSTVYYVKVTWNSLQFTYTHPNKGTWNPEAHLYESTEVGKWVTDTATFTVANHSNAAVNVIPGLNLAGADTVNNEGVILTLTQGEDAPLATYTLGSADTTERLDDPSKADTIKYTIKATGTPGENVTNGMTLAKLVINISQA